jgi:hypothetical protein
LIAWAADFARRRHDADLVAEMPSLLEHWTMPPLYDRDESQAAQDRAIQAVLDTLIQENVQVSIQAIKTVAPVFPAQASILIGRLPLTESRVTLGDWTYGAGGNSSGRMLARIASMMLAKDPGGSQGVWNGNLAGFVASVVAASEEELQITVSSSNTGQCRGGFGNACGDSIGHKLTPGWPQVYAYGLEEENLQKVKEPIVVDLDGDQIYYRRYEENGGWGSCSGVQWLNSSTRHRIIAHWLGVPEKEMSWQPVEYFAIVWTGKAAYQRQLGEIVEAEREKLHGTVESLRQRGFLREGEGASLSPRLLVKVQCEINPCPLD